MSPFCVAQINEPLLRPAHGVLRAAGLSATSDARHAAEQILQEARAAAQLVTDAAHAQARDAVRQAQADTLQRAEKLLRALEQKNAAFVAGAQDLVSELTLALFDRLVAETTPRERVAASCRRLLQEAPRQLARPVLYLHPDECALAPDTAWEIKADAKLAPGACRLEASDGEWRADFSDGAAALRTAFTMPAHDDHDATTMQQRAQPDSAHRRMPNDQ